MNKLLLLITCAFVISQAFLYAAGPANVSTGLQMWLDANALSLSDGTAISSWTDQSGNNKHAVQDTTAFQPKFRTNIVNGKPAIVFDGTNDYLAFNGNIIVNTNYTIIAVLRRNIGSTAHHCFLGGTKTSQNKNLHIGWQSNNTFYHAQYSNDYAMRVTNYSAGEQPLIVSLRHSNTLGNDTYIDGGLRGLDMYAGRLAHLTEWNGAAIGRYIDGSINPRFNGWVAELIMYNRYLSETERKAIESYLSAKYNVSIGNTASPEHYTNMVNVSVSSAVPTLELMTGGLTLKGTYVPANSAKIITGHNNAIGLTAANNPNIATYPRFLRLNRAWFMEFTGTLNTQFRFSLDSLSVGSFSPNGNDYRLLFRNNTKNNYTVVTTSPIITGRVITFNVNSLVAVTNNGFYTLGTLDNQISTLPVELSSFTAISTAQSFVKLNWTTQSETNVSGYYIFRSETNNLAAAQRINAFIGATNTSQEAVYTFTDTEVLTGHTWYYWLQHLELNGESQFHGPISIALTNDNNIPFPVIPFVTGLKSIYPNPFNSWTFISYDLAKDTHVSIEVYNLKGQIVRSLMSGTKNSGSWRILWDGKDSKGETCTTGIYYIKLSAGKNTCLKKVIILK